jgi:ABC-type antimicrobial peptide transport system permease subunit
VLLVSGLVAGLTGGAVLARFVGAMLYGVGPSDVGVFAAAAGGIIAIAVLATGLPARRAMRVDPIIALRAD